MFVSAVNREDIVPADVVHCMIAFHSPTIKASHCFQFPILQSSMRTLAQIPPGLRGKVWKVCSRPGVLAEGHPGNITEGCLKLLSGQLPSHSSMLEPVYMGLQVPIIKFLRILQACH